MDIVLACVVLPTVVLLGFHAFVIVVGAVIDNFFPGGHGYPDEVGKI